MTLAGNAADPNPIRLPRQMASATHDVLIGPGRETGTLTVSTADGTGAVAVDLRVGKHGTTVAALAEATGTAVTLGLRHGAPAGLYADKLRDMGLAVLGARQQEYPGIART